MKWQNVTIADFLDSGQAHLQTGPFGTQLKASQYVAHGTPVINVRNIGLGKLANGQLEFVPEGVADRLEVHLLKADDIVFGRRGAVDRHLIVAEDQQGWMQGSDCMRLRFETDRLYARFLSYCFLSPTHRQWMLTQASNKATMAGLNHDVIRRIAFRVPPPQVQKEIVRILSVYDDLIANNGRRVLLLEQAARLLYEEWFVRLRFPGREHTRVTNGIPAGWQRKVLGDLCVEVREQISPLDMEPGTPYIGLEHIPRRSITLLDWGRAEDVTSTKHRFRAGEILFGKIRPYFHKVGFALTDGVASSDAIVIRPITEQMRSLVLMTVSSDHFVKMVSQTMREGSKMPRADWKVMQQHAVATPPTSILDAFNAFIQPIVYQLRVLSLQTRKAREARDLLLPRLMSGEVAV